MSIQERVAVITGATGGLGRVVAKYLAEQGAHLALLSTNQEKLEQLAHELQLPPDRYLLRAMNLREPRAVAEAAQAVRARFGHADVLLQFVGGWIGGKPVTAVETGEVAEMLDQHLWTTLYLVQAFVPQMVAQKWGRIIVISSPTASRPAAQRAPYAIGKAAQEALMLTLAEETKYTGVTANLLVVSTIDVKHQRDREQTAQTAAWTAPEEIASTIGYLCSDEAHTINGARIPLYGSA